MGIEESAIQKVEEWAWNVAAKKAIAAALGFLASQTALSGIAWLEAHGIKIQLDPVKMQTSFDALGVAGFALAHDWLKLKFPESKWL